MTPQDEVAREAARRDLDTSLLVEAGAGTGKTSLIVDRIANLVDAGVALDDVVAITFTEKAAGELRLRVRAELERRSSDPERHEDVRSRAHAALSVLDRAAITTIHAWCARLLREYPVEAGVDPLFSVLDANARQELFDRTWEQWLGRELSREGAAPFDIALFTADEWVRELEGIARMLVEHRAELPAALPAEIGGDPLAAALAALDLLDIPALTAPCSSPDDGLVSTFGAVMGFRERFRNAPTVLRRELLLRHDHLGRSGYSNWGNRANWGGKKSEALPRAREALTSAQDAWIRARTTLTNDVCVRVARWLAEGFLPEYETEKRSAGTLDFDDLLLLARDLIRDHPYVRARLRRRLRLILDEFQDTDPVQCETAFLLASNANANHWQEARPLPGALFLVGDPKQSIYAFRGADVETYSAARDLLAAGGHLREISTNFRSRAPVLEWVNAVFDKLLVESPDPRAARFQIGYRPLQAHLGAGSTGAGVHLIRPEPGAEFPTVFHSRDAEARAVAGLVRDHAVGHWVVRDRSGADRPARLGDVVVLLRNRKSSLPAFERAFRAASIPFVVVGGRALWARAEVRALTAVCRAVENPFDGVSVVAALKSPFFGASDADLLRWRHQQGSLAAHREVVDDGSVVGAALARLARWHQSRTEIPPARLLEQILAETGAVASFGLKPDGPQRVANLLRLLDAARSADVSENGVRQSFRAWVGWLAERAGDIREEAEGAVLEEDADAVRILTMHAAKGLEFPIVILGDLAMRDSRAEHRIFDRARHSLQFRISARDVRLETAGLEQAREGLDARQEAEDRRLLYVAATRARDALVVPLFASDKKASFHRTLVETFPSLLEAPAGSTVGAGEGGPAIVHVVGENLQPVHGEPPVLRLPVEQLEAALALAQPPATNAMEDPDARSMRLAIAERTRARQIRSVTSILPTDAAPRVYAGISTGLTREEAALVGESVHAALEHGDLADPDDLERNARLQARARLLSAPATDRAARLARGAAGLPALLRARTAARTMREWAFVLPVDAGFWSAGAWLLEGVIDLAWIEKGGLVILDYKTDAVARSEEAIAEAAAHHLPQLLAYAWAASRATGLKVHSTVVALLEAERAVERRVTEDDLLRARGWVEAAFAAPRPFNQLDLRR